MKGDPPRVSVLMAVFNAERHVAQVIQSVLAQTCRDFELVLVDDGSTDRSHAILQRFAAADPRLVLHRQSNQGIGAAMNQALVRARAPLVAILDSDDVMLPHRLARQIDWMGVHPEIAAAGSQFLTIDTAGQLTGLDRHPVGPGIADKLMFGYFCLHHPTIIARRNVLLSLGGYEEGRRRGSPEYGLFMKLAVAGHSMTNLPEVLTCWRHTPDGASFGHSREQTEDALSIRGRGYAALCQRDPARALEVCQLLTARFAGGTELDDKARRLGLGRPLPPGMLALTEAAVSVTGLDRLERLAARWLVENDDPELAFELGARGYPWLSRILRRYQGLPRPGGYDAEASPPLVLAAARPGLLSVLLPMPDATAAVDAQMLTGALASLPEFCEILAFGPDIPPPACDLLVRDSRVRVLKLKTPEPGRRWAEALAQVQGEFIAVHEWGGIHAPGFLAAAVTTLIAHPELGLVHACHDLLYPDALDESGAPMRDPARTPRWTRDALLGRDRARLHDLVFRSRLLATVPLQVAECVSQAPRLLARCLLLTAPSQALSFTNQVVGDPAGIGLPAFERVVDLAVRWYLDSGFGTVPPSDSRVSETHRKVRERLHRLNALARQKRLFAHPGNVNLLLGFIVSHAHFALAEPGFPQLLRTHPGPALASLRQRSRLQTAAARCWSLAQRLAGRLGVGV